MEYIKLKKMKNKNHETLFTYELNRKKYRLDAHRSENLHKNIIPKS